jgi:signal transduction histidine kinase
MEDIDTWLWILLGVMAGTAASIVLQPLRAWLGRIRTHSRDDLMLELSQASLRLTAAGQTPTEIAEILSSDVQEWLGLERSAVLLVSGDRLQSIFDDQLALPIQHAVIRRVAGRGEAVRVDREMARWIDQGRAALTWTQVWVPILHGTELHGIWLLGGRKQKKGYSRQLLDQLTILGRQAGTTLALQQALQLELDHAAGMKSLYREGVRLRESARSELARELHDGVLQDLCTISRDLKALQASGDATINVDRLINRSEESVAALRAICHDLRPPFLAKDLVVALRALAERSSERSGLPVSFETQSQQLNLMDEQTLAIYRIAQEAISNSLQHAEASEIVIRLVAYPERLRLTITDDGVGLNPSQRPESWVAAGHFGLAGMQERAEIIAAELQFETANEYGTAVVLEVPFTEAA